jgi:peptidoglycan hydrolase-like protein with peptidoglycan-binding domain
MQGTKYQDELAKYHNATKAYQDLPGTANLQVKNVPLIGDINVTPGDVAGLLLGAGLIKGAWNAGAKTLGKLSANKFANPALRAVGGLTTTAVAPGVAHAVTDTDDGDEEPQATNQQPAGPQAGTQPQGQKKPYDVGTHDQIRALQKIIGAKQDGFYGPETKGKLKAWQQSQGLTPDGVPGPNTYAAMVKFATGKDPQQAAAELQKQQATAESVTYKDDQALARILKLSR